MFLVRVNLPVPLRMIYMAAIGAFVPFVWLPIPVSRPLQIACGIAVAIFFEVFNFVSTRKT